MNFLDVASVLPPFNHWKPLKSLCTPHSLMYNGCLQHLGDLCGSFAEFKAKLDADMLLMKIGSFVNCNKHVKWTSVSVSNTSSDVHSKLSPWKLTLHTCAVRPSATWWYYVPLVWESISPGNSSYILKQRPAFSYEVVPVGTNLVCQSWKCLTISEVIMNVGSVRRVW